MKSRSALAELRCATSGFEAVLLALLHTRIAGQETGLLQDGTVVLAGQQQGAGDPNAQANGAQNADNASSDGASDADYDVH